MPRKSLPVETKQKYNINANKNIGVSVRTIDYVVPLHWHNFYEFELIVDGSAKETIDKTEFEVSRGCCYFLSTSDYHDIRPETDIKILNISLTENILSKEQLDRIVLKDNVMFYRLNEKQLEFIEKLTLLCLEESFSEKSDSKCLEMLVSCLLEKLFELGNVEKVMFDKTVSYPIQNAITYINAHFLESPNLKSAADAAGYNENYFSSMFHKEIGISYREYLTKLKIDYAKRLLISTELSIEHISFSCGFRSYSSFLQAFTKAVGFSPQKYRGKSQKQTPEFDV